MHSPTPSCEKAPLAPSRARAAWPPPAPTRQVLLAASMSDLYSGAVADPALPDQPFTDWAWRVAGYVDGLAAAAGGIGSGGAYETAPASDFAAVSNSDTPLAASDNTTAAGHAYLIRPRPVYPRAGHSKLQPLAGLERPDSVALGRLSPFGGSFFMAGGRHLDSLPPMCPRFAASPPPLLHCRCFRRQRPSLTTIQSLGGWRVPRVRPRVRRSTFRRGSTMRRRSAGRSPRRPGGVWARIRAWPQRGRRLQAAANAVSKGLLAVRRELCRGREQSGPVRRSPHAEGSDG